MKTVKYELSVEKRLTRLETQMKYLTIAIVILVAVSAPKFLAAFGVVWP